MENNSWGEDTTLHEIEECLKKRSTLCSEFTLGMATRETTRYSADLFAAFLEPPEKLGFHSKV
jgi:hypothetical protein